MIHGPTRAHVVLSTPEVSYRSGLPNSGVDTMSIERSKTLAGLIRYGNNKLDIGTHTRSSQHDSVGTVAIITR